GPAAHDAGRPRSEGSDEGTGAAGEPQPDPPPLVGPTGTPDEPEGNSGGPQADPPPFVGPTGTPDEVAGTGGEPQANPTPDVTANATSMHSDASTTAEQAGDSLSGDVLLTPEEFEERNAITSANYAASDACMAACSELSS